MLLLFVAVSRNTAFACCSWRSSEEMFVAALLLFVATLLLLCCSWRSSKEMFVAAWVLCTMRLYSYFILDFVPDLFNVIDVCFISDLILEACIRLVSLSSVK
ncbi:hypothetical protein Droror1_Dr00015962 [Drosera rotundifolia]